LVMVVRLQSRELIEILQQARMDATNAKAQFAQDT
jgi:hypothetical protein